MLNVLIKISLKSVNKDPIKSIVRIDSVNGWTGDKLYPEPKMTSSASPELSRLTSDVSW